MTRKLATILCVILLLTALGCGEQSHTVDNSEPIVSVVDSLGNTVTLSTLPRNTAVLFSSFAEIWQLAGGRVGITVGESVERGFVSDGTPLVDEGAGKSINLELLLSYKPDLVIGSADIPAHKEACELLSKAGIPVLLFVLEDFSDYLFVLEAMTDVTGRKDLFDEYGSELKKEVDAILQGEAAANWHGKRILFVRAGTSASGTKAKRAKDHFACAMLQELGCLNIADNAPVLLDGLNMEAILTYDPEYIFFSLMGNEEGATRNVNSLLESDAWQALTAVKQGRVVILPRELFHFKPNARWAMAYSYLVRLGDDSP